MRIDDYRTFWPEEESPPAPQSTPAPRPQPRPRRRTVQRGTAYMRGIGPHVALYFLLGAVLPFAGLVVLGFLSMLFTLLASIF
jgi:hypothetical protein